MKVTVITPTFNRAELLPRTIESVLAQDFTNFEYLILDDGSVDNTRFVVEPFLADSRVKYHFHENAGEAETVNWGWSLARGEYFAQVNSDDPVYPDFLRIMVDELDKHDDVVLAYPDFHIIDRSGEIVSTTRGRAWNFLRNLAEFSCEAACPGTIIRRSAFSDLDKIKSGSFLHINDIEMYWNLALRGNFLHVPRVLATWRAHDGQISAYRYKSIPECEEWFANYFSQSNIPEDVLALKETVRKSLCSYFVQLVESAPLTSLEKRKMAAPYQRELGVPSYEFHCLHVGDNDIVGNKFNGHDLHLYLQEKNILAFHAVCHKQSSDSTTFEVDTTNSKKYLESLIQSKVFLDADVVHLHLMHNTPFDINDLSLLSSLKPVVWTLHDPWVLGGHCIHPGACLKWKRHCCDCNSLQTPFAIKYDTSALEFFIKKQAIQRSHVHAIVASSWMRDKVSQSPIWDGKVVHTVPFGIDQSKFRPCEIAKAKIALGLDPNSLVLFVRTQRDFKGLELLRSVLPRVACSQPYVLLSVGERGLLSGLPTAAHQREFGWLTDDDKLISLYQACDIFLMPSEQEAFGMMAIEAMSCGKLVLSLDVPTSSVPRIIDAPRCGIAVSQEDYGDELLRLLSSPEEILWRGEQCLSFARKHYSHQTYVDNIVDVYRRVIDDFALSDSARLLLQQLERYALHQQSGNPEIQIMQYPYESVSYYTRLLSYYKQYGLTCTIKKVLQIIHRALCRGLQK